MPSHRRVPEIGPYRILQGVRLVPAEDVIRMKLTSFEAGVITAAIESALNPLHKERLQQVRAR